jgi:hypothetical protein
MMMWSDGTARRQRFLSQTAIRDARSRPINERPNLGAVRRMDDTGLLAIHNDHMFPCRV